MSSRYQKRVRLFLLVFLLLFVQDDSVIVRAQVVNQTLRVGGEHSLADTIVINEIDVDTPSTDTLEFIELYDGGSGNTDLSGLVLVFYNGGNDQSYESFDLDGYSTDSQGYFVIGNSAVSGVDLVFRNSSLQNGADAVAIYVGDGSDFPNNTPLTTDGLLDAIVYDTSDSDDAGLLSLLNDGQPQVNENGNGEKDTESSQRCPNGAGGGRNTDAYLQLVPTPGEANNCQAEIAVLGNDILIASGDTMPEAADHTDFGGAGLNGGSVARTFAIENTGTADLNLTLPISISGAHADEFAVTAQPSSPVSASGGTTTFTVAFDPAAGGTRTATISIANNDSDENPYTFAIQGTGAADTVIINEVDADQTGSDTADFIELYDGGDGNTDFSGLVLVLYNGSDDQSYDSFDLDGYATNAEGYFVLGDSGVPGVDAGIEISSVQNGADAVAIYVGDGADFPNDTPLTTDNLLDAIVYDTGQADASGLLPLLNGGQPQVNEDENGKKETESNQRCPNGAGGGRNTDTYLQRAPTPGASNDCPPEIDIQGNNVSIPDGDTIPAAADETDFSSTPVSSGSVAHTFTIKNTGSGALNLTLPVAVSGAHADDFTVTAQPSTLLAPNGSTTFEITFAPTAEGQRTATVSIANNDSDENPYDFAIQGTGTESNPPGLISFTRDTPAATPTNADTLVFRAIFDEDVQNVDAADFVVDSASTAGVTDVSPVVAAAEYEVTVSGGDLVDFDGILGLNLAPGQDISDMAGNPLPADEPATEQSYTLDNSVPAPTISAPPSPTNSELFDVTIDFCETVSGFASADITVGNGTVSDLTDNGTGSYTARINANRDGQVTVDIGAGVTQDLAGNDNAAAAQFSVTVDTTAPTVTINQPAGQSDPTNASLVNFIVQFSEPVSGFSAGDVILGGTAGAATTLVTQIAPNDGTTFNVAVSGMSSDGTVIASLASGVATDTAGNGNTASTSSDNLVTYDTTTAAPGTPDLDDSNDSGTSNNDDITNDATPRFTGACENGATVMLSSSLDGDLTPTGTCSGGLYNIALTTILSEGEHAITASQVDAAGNISSASVTLNVTVDTTKPSVSINQAAAQADPTNASPMNFTAVFDEPVNAATFTGADVDLSNGTATTGAVSVTEIAPNNGTTFDVSVVVTGDGTIQPTIPGNGIEDLAGNTNIASTSTDNNITFDSDPSGLTSFTLHNPATTPTNADTLVFRVTFDEDVRNVDSADFAIDSTSTAGITGVTVVSANVYDVTVSGGDLADFVGTVGLNLALGQNISDLAGNALPAGEPATDEIYTVDNAGPTIQAITSTTADGAYKVGDTINVTVTFSENVTLSGGTLDVTLDTGDVVSIAAFSAADTASGSYTVSVGDTSADLDSTGIALGRGILRDAAGNHAAGTLPATTIADSSDIVIDTTAPAPTINGPTSPTGSDPFTVAIDFGEVVTGFESTDITVGNGSVNGLTDNGSGSYTVSIDATSDGQITVNIGVAVAQDLAGNDNIAAEQFSVTMDTDAPAPTISSTANDPTNTSPISVTIDFNEAVSGFTVEDITVGNGAKNDFSGSGASYTLNITPLADGSVTVDVDAGAAADTARNDNIAAAQFSITYDTTALVPGMPDLAAASDTGMSDTDNITTETAPQFTGSCESGATVTLQSSMDGDLTPTDLCSGGLYDILLTSALSEGKHAMTASQVDAAGNISPSSNALSVTIDDTAPTVTIEQAVGQTDPTNTSPVNFIAQFSEPVSGFSDGDVNLGGTANPSSGLVTEIVPNDGTTYNVAVSGMTTDGTVTTSVERGIASDTAGNGNAASTSTDNTVTFDTTITPPGAPDLAVGSDAGISDMDDLTNYATLQFTGSCETGAIVSLSSSLDGGLTPAGLCTGGLYDITVSLNDGAHEIIAFQVDTAGNSSSSSGALSVTVDTANPGVNINQATGQSDPANAAPVFFTAVFDEPVSTATFTNADVDLSGSTATTGAITINEIAPNDGTVTASIPAGGVADLAGNTNTASTTTDNTVAFDASDPVDPVVTSPSHTVGVWSNDPMIDIEWSDAADAGSGLSGYSYEWSTVPDTLPDTVQDMAHGADPHTLTSPSLPEGGNHYFHLRSKDAAGNWTDTVHLGPFQIDLTAPSVPSGLSPADGAYTNDLSPTLSWDASTDNGGSGLHTSATYRVIVTGTPGMADYTSNTNYVPQLMEGTFTWKVYARDNAGNDSAWSSEYTLTIDATAPVPTISGPASPTGSDPFDVKIDFGEDVIGFEIDDITIGNGSVSSLTDNGSGSYTASIDAAADGLVTVDINAGVTQDLAGNDNTAAPQFNISVDTTPPTVTINQLAGQSDPTNASLVNFIVQFSEPVSGFSAGDVILGGTAGAATTLVTQIAPNDGTTFNVAVSGMSSDGTVIASLASGVATDTAGNGNTASTSTDNRVTYDGSAPGATINQAASQPDPTNSSPVFFTAIFDEPVNTATFTNADVELSGSTATTGAITINEIAPNDGTTFGVSVVVMEDGIVTASIPAGGVADLVGNLNSDLTSTDNSITYDTAAAAPGAPDLSAASDTGATDGDDRTDDATPQFTGTCETDATVTLNSDLDGNLAPTGNCENGAYDITVTGALSEGAHAITAFQVDAAGNTSPTSASLIMQVIFPTLTVNMVSPMGADAVNSSTGTPDPGPFDCPATRCVATFALDENITLNVNVDSTSGFDGWSGDCAAWGTVLMGDLLMDDDKVCTATFSASDMDVEGNSVSISDGDTTPTTVDDTAFDNVSVGDSLNRTFTIQNEGNKILDLTGTPIVQLSGSPDFSVEVQPAADSIHPGGAGLDFVVRCAPAAIGAHTATVSIASNDPDENPYTFDLACTGIAPEIDLQHPAGTSIPDGGADNIGNQAPTTIHLTYTLDNSAGSDRLSISDVTADERVNVSNFSLLTALPINIPAGETANVDIAFNVDALGAFSLAVHLANNDLDENPYDIQIAGVGAAVPEINMRGNGEDILNGDTTPQPADHTDFGNADKNGAIITRTFTIQNKGSADLTLPLLPTITGAQAGDFTITVFPDALIPPGGETTFGIAYDPEAQGLSEAIINIANDDNDENPYVFAISGTGTGPAPELDVLGNGLSIPAGDTTPRAADNTDFGNVFIGRGAVTYTYTVQNTGSVDLNLMDDPIVVIGGAHAAEFVVTADPDTPVPAGSGETTFEITFNPRGLGLRQAMVSIATDDNDENPYEFAIQGTGFIPGTTDGADEDAAHSELLASVGPAGGAFEFERLAVTVPEGTLAAYSNCQMSLGGKGGNIGFSPDDPVYDVSITCADGTPETFDPPLEVCLKPTTDQLDAAGHFANLHLFHSHKGESWTPLYDSYEQDGYLCAQLWQLSYFTIAVPELPDTGFPQDMVTVLDEQPAEKIYFELGDFTLEIPALNLELPIMGVPLTKDGWDVSWLGEAAGYLEGTAYPTWAGNTVITAHVWDANNHPGPFVSLHTLSYGDEIIIRAWGQAYVYEVRALTEVSPADLRALPHSEYDLLTLVTCKDFNPSLGKYNWRLVVEAILVEIR